MWCATCQAHVGKAPDIQPTSCPRCGTALIDPPSATTVTDKARELLQNWSTDDPLAMPPPPADKGPTTKTPADAARDPSQRRLRVDTAHSKHQPTPGSQNTKEPATTAKPTPIPAQAKNPDSSTPHQQPATTHSSPDLPANKDIPRENDPLVEVASTLANFSVDHTPPAKPSAKPPAKPSAKPLATRTDPPHHPESTSAPPTADPQQAHDPEPTTPIPTGVTTSGLTHSTSLWGQLLAYVGVLGLTAGGALIIWNGFGHAPVNAPTSWLIATGGQMLLFLGIVTLVSSGLEQTNEDVNRQVRVLGEQLLRIERGQSERANAAPHLARRPDASATPAAQRSGDGATKPK